MLKISDKVCDKCNISEANLIKQLLDLLEDQQSKCSLRICQQCIKKFKDERCRICNKRINEHRNTFKHRAVIDFEKQQKQRKGLSEKKYVPQILIQIAVHNKIEHTINNKALTFLLEYEKKKLRAEHHVTAGDNQNRQRIYPVFLGSTDNSSISQCDGRIPSGYDSNKQKGIKEIIQAFNNPNFKFTIN